MSKPFKRLRINKDGSKTVYWYIRYMVNGKEKWESIGKVGEVTKAVAQARLEEKKGQVRLDRLDMIGAKIPTLSDFSTEYLKYVKEVVTKKSWKRDELSIKHLNIMLGAFKLSHITPKDIQDYQSKRLKDGKRPATINRELACLKHLINIAKQRSKFFGDNPVSKIRFLVEDNQKDRVLTPEEEQNLISCSAPHLVPILVTALNTGMRKFEILSLKWTNIDLENDLIVIEATNTKSKRLKRIPINSSLRKMLLEQKLKTGVSEYVFLTPDGKPYKRQDSLKKSFLGACTRAGIKGLRFHDLRHTAATRMIESGVSIVAVSKILGHSSLMTTMRYAHPDDTLREAVEKLGNFTQTVAKSVAARNQNRAQPS